MAVGGAVWPGLARGAGWQERRETGLLFDWVQAGPHVRVARTYGANAVVIAMTEGVLLVDSKTSAVGATLLAEAGELDGGVARAAVKTAVNTSASGSSTGGNLALNEAHAAIIASVKAKERIATQTNEYISQVKELVMDFSKATAHPPERAIRNAQVVHAKWTKLKASDFAPTRTVDAETSERVGAIEYTLVPMVGRTDGDLVVRVKSLNLVCPGLLVSSKEHPTIEKGLGGTVATWVAGLEKLAGMCDEKTVVAAGMGPPTDVKGVRAQIEYFATLKKAVEEARAKKMQRAEVAKLKPAGLEGLGNSERLARNLVTVLDELNSAGGAGG